MNIELEQLIQEISKLSLEEKKKLNTYLLDEICKEEQRIEELPEEERRNMQRVKNMKILEVIKQWEQDDDYNEYCEKNKEAIEAAINATIRK
jgi:hypothetical protein